MTGQSASSNLQALFEAALRDYEKQTGIPLAKHPLVDKLQNCDTVESITTVLHEQTQAFSDFREKDKVLKPLKSAVLVLCKLSSAASFGQAIGLVRP
jgi:fungal STAND N-terminal Goodbye domain